MGLKVHMETERKHMGRIIGMLESAGSLAALVLVNLKGVSVFLPPILS